MLCLQVAAEATPVRAAPTSWCGCSSRPTASRAAPTPDAATRPSPASPAPWDASGRSGVGIGRRAGGRLDVDLAAAAESDHDIAGLMLRCGEGATTEVLVVLVEPLPARTHQKVTVVAGRTTTEFTGSIVTSGALVLLPEKASALVENAWQSVPELTVAIADNHRSLHGVIPLADIGTAMRTLQSNCPEGTRSR